MGTLGHRDLRDVLFVTRAALECGEIDEMRMEVLSSLERIFKCSLSGFQLASGTHDKLDLDRAVVRGSDSETSKKYRYYHSVNPVTHSLPFLPPVSTFDQVISPRELIKTDFYNDFLRPHSLHLSHYLFMTLKTGKQLLGVVGLARPHRMGNFSFREKAKAELLIPYLANILEEKIHLEKLRRRTAILDSVSLDLSYKVVMLLDEYLDPIYVDEGADQLLSLFTHEKIRPEESQRSGIDELSFHCRELIMSSHREENQEPLQKQLTLKTDETGQALTILLRLIEYQDKPAFLVCLKPNEPLLFFEQRLIKLGLTKREREVVYLLYQGLEDIEISKKLYISRYTVGNHLKSIFSKLGVCNRTSVIHRILTLE